MVLVVLGEVDLLTQLEQQVMEVMVLMVVVVEVVDLQETQAWVQEVSVEKVETDWQ
jgi:hypothetical protein